MQKYKFYMQEVFWNGSTYVGYVIDENGTQTSTATKIYDLESEFDGLHYKQCEGLEDLGKPRTYSETFAEFDGERTYLPKNIVRDPTTVKLTLYFVGENRRNTYNAFTAYITAGFHDYWDDARKKRFTFYVKDEIKVSEDTFVGSTPYIQVTYTLQNVNGYTKDVNLEE